MEVKMTFQRDLAWQYLNVLNQSSVSYQLARYALSISYESLPPEVIHQAKRCTLDTLGCAIGAYDAPGRPMCEKTIKQLGGVEEATVFGSGFRTSAPNATLVNSFLVRFLDYNDIGGGGHNSDSIPSILAVAESQKKNGRDFLTAVVTSYELGARYTMSLGIKGVAQGGWLSDIRGGLSMPPTLGRMMGLNVEQIANAIGICACHSLPLEILDTDREENSMSKNIRFGSVAYNAIVSCLLAKNGFTGPVRIVEGENGLRQVVCRGDMDLKPLLDFSDWKILDTRFKILCLDGSSIGHVLATLALVNEHDLKPEDIAAVRITTSQYEANHTTYLPKKYPRSAENADHSAFWSNAMAIRDHRISPDSFDPKNYTDPVVLDLIEKITVVADPQTDGVFWGESEITTKDGRVFHKRLENAHGFGNDPLTDAELENKFRETTGKYLSKQKIDKIIDTVWNMEKLGDISSIPKLMVVSKK
jgi:2-methylcitrate dehydratase